MDIATITATNNELSIIDPKSSEPIGLIISVLPKTHPAVQAIERKITNESLRTRGKSLTAEKLEANKLDILVAATAAWKWEGDLTWHGQKPECSPQTIRKVYKELPWVKEQVDNAFGDEAAFFRGDNGGTV